MGPIERAAAGRIDLLQALRALAAILVAGFHLQAAARSEGDYEGLFLAFRHGGTGVDLFFVISGFIIYYTARRQPKLETRAFLASRFWRIYPTYWAVLSVYVAVAAADALTPRSLGSEDALTAASLVTSTLLLPLPWHILDVSWTLAIEVMFYALFALAYFRWRERGLFIALGLWAAAAQIARLLGVEERSLLGMVLFAGVVEFLFGAVAAWLHLSGKARHCRAALAIGLLLFAARLGGVDEALGLPLSREWGAGIPSALVVYGAAGLAWRVPSLILLFGEASYILYLTHLLTYAALSRAASALAGIDIYGSTPSMAAALIIALAAASAATLLFERPFHRWYKRRLRAKAKAPDPVAAARDSAKP